MGAETNEPQGLADAINMTAINTAQFGMIDDMNKVADALYGR